MSDEKEAREKAENLASLIMTGKRANTRFNCDEDLDKEVARGLDEIYATRKIKNIIKINRDNSEGESK